MGTSAREALERDSATWPLWQRRLAFGLRWPVRLAYILCGAIVILEIPNNDVILLAAKVGALALCIWFALGEIVRALHLSFDEPDMLPVWLQRILRACMFPARWGLALSAPLIELVPLVFVFPSLKGTTAAEIVVVLLCLGLAIGFGPMVLLVAGMVLALPIIIPIGIVRSIRNRRDRRYRQTYRYLGQPPW